MTHASHSSPAPFPQKIHDHWHDAANVKGFAIIRRVADRYHLLLRCEACGGTHRTKLFVLMNNQPICPHCTESSWKEYATVAGLVWHGRDPEDRHYGFYEAPCGHKLRRQFELIKRIADGECSHRCEICHSAKEQSEAEAQGWILLGAAPEREMGYRSYRHSCGHEQVIARANMQTGRFNCEACGEGWASAPSYIYCMRFELPELPPMVKLGFSRNPESRLNYQLKKRPDLQGEILHMVALPTGHKALCAEKQMHAALKRDHPHSMIPPEMYAPWLRVKSEIYTADLETVILDMLDALPLLPDACPPPPHLVISNRPWPTPTLWRKLMSNTQSWAPYARDILRRLRHSQTVVTHSIFYEKQPIVPVGDPPTQNVLEALSKLDEAQTRDSRELAEMGEAGIDGQAMDENVNDRPNQRIPADKILLCLQLAATFGSHRDFCERTLAPGAVNVIEGFKMNQMETAATQIGRLFLPADWVALTYAAKSMTSPALQIISPTVSSKGTLTPSSQYEFERKVLSSLAQPHPLLILLPDGLRLDPNLCHILPDGQRLAALDGDMMLMLLAETHSATRKVDSDVVRPLLPDDAALKSLTAPILIASLRAPTASGAAKHMSDLLRVPADPNGAMTLEHINGNSPAHHSAQGLVDDLTAWRTGEAPWSEISHSLLISGEPGVGKSFLARAIAASAEVPLIQGSFGGWQARGHLGDMLGAMTKSFAEAIRQKPSVLFVDEIDAAGSRDSDDKQNSNYRRNVINHFLAEVDALMRAEGVLLIGACNHSSNLDPAILRPGRFDQHANLGRPPLAQIRHMISRLLPDDTELDALALAFVGRTPAVIDAQLRSAKSSARRAGRSFDAAWVLAHMPAETPQTNARQRRIALHECGHAIVAALLGAVPVTQLVLSNGTGQTHRSNVVHEGLLSEFEDEMTILLAGRAAERVVLGTISGGAGGAKGSDLQLATQLLLSCDREAGLGIHGNSWLGEADVSRLTQHDRDRLRVKLDKIERRAMRLLEPYRDRLERLAAHLLEKREMDTDALHPWLQDLIPAARAPIDSTQAGFDPS